MIIYDWGKSRNHISGLPGRESQRHDQAGFRSIRYGIDAPLRCSGNPRVQRGNTRLRLSSDDEANSFANRSIWSELNETLRDTPR
jgi:hypothetical protein